MDNVCISQFLSLDVTLELNCNNEISIWNFIQFKYYIVQWS
jgi:hypothetical protein